MSDPGYGPNGERLAATSNPIVWEANAPPVVIPAGDDVHTISPLGVTTLPVVDQDDDTSIVLQSAVGPIMFVVAAGQDVQTIWPLGNPTLPKIDQADDDVWSHIYPGGAPITVVTPPTDDWLLFGGVWSDSGVWDDADVWID